MQNIIANVLLAYKIWLRDQDSNLEPPGYGPGELPNCSIPRYLILLLQYIVFNKKSQVLTFERVRRVELLSPVWKTGIIAVI